MISIGFLGSSYYSVRTSIRLCVRILLDFDLDLILIWLWIWIWAGFGLILAGFGSICFGSWSIRALIALIAL